jgi:hypothetical protein
MKKMLTSIALLAGAATAQAGTRSSYPVYIGATYAYGSLGTARASSDTLSYVECQRYVTPSNAVLTCYVRDAAGKTAMCITNDPSFVAEGRALKGDSLLYFEWDANGYCKALRVTDSSYLAPKSP